jgi:indole-3-glycerol phosphate synthase
MSTGDTAVKASILASIIASKQREVHVLKHRTCYARIPDGPRGNCASSLRRGAGQPLRLIAENKRKSPSAGSLSSVLTPAARAVRYAEAGAAMVSVLCDAPFFGGSWDDVVEVRRALIAAGHALPILAKEFIIDERQLREASASGADAVLLIARILDRARLAQLFEQASSLGLEPLVEVVNEEEVDSALAAGATLIGVNARDLDTLVMDAARAAAVVAAIPRSAVAVHLSGLKTAEDVRRIACDRADGALVGETLMRQDDPTSLLSELVRAARI